MAERMTRRYKATIDIYVELTGEQNQIDAEGACADGISETMRDAIARSAQIDGFLIDWSYSWRDGDYTYAQPFEGQTPEEEFQA